MPKFLIDLNFIFYIIVVTTYPHIFQKNKRTALQYARRAGRGATDVINILEEWAHTHPEQSQIACKYLIIMGLVTFSGKLKGLRLLCALPTPST